MCRGSCRGWDPGPRVFPGATLPLPSQSLRDCRGCRGSVGHVPHPFCNNVPGREGSGSCPRLGEHALPWPSGERHHEAGLVPAPGEQPASPCGFYVSVASAACCPHSTSVSRLAGRVLAALPNDRGAVVLSRRASESRPCPAPPATPPGLRARPECPQGSCLLCWIAGPIWPDQPLVQGAPGSRERLG